MSTDEVIDKWTRETENYKDISVTMEQGSTTSSSMSSTNQIEVDLQSTDYDALKKASDELVEELRKREDVMQVHSSIENAAPVIKVNVDPVLAQAEGSYTCVHRISDLQQFKWYQGNHSPCKR